VRAIAIVLAITGALAVSGIAARKLVVRAAGFLVLLVAIMALVPQADGPWLD
jgi:hypothetical protein